MIQKVQKYLLENYPLLWNIRIFPLAIIIIITNLFFFGIGYLFTDNDFDEKFYHINFVLGIIYFVSIVTGVLILIGWLMNYMRNNAFQAYYPRKTVHIYLEWILCFIICVGITIIPLSLMEGSNQKWRTVCSKNDAKRALEIIDQVEILIPRNYYDYLYKRREYMEPIRIPDGMSVNLDSSNIDQYAYSKDNKNNLIPKGYIGASLLFYYDNYTYTDENEPPTRLLTEKEKKTKQIKSWLENGEQDKIKALMGEYMKLVEKHKIPTNLTIDSWFDRIYHPPFFPVDSNSVIEDNLFRDSFDSNHYHNKPYIQDNWLYRGYKEILDSYDGTDTTRKISLVCLCVPLAISVLIFSCRITDVKKWIQSLVCAGVLILIVSFVTVLISIDQHLLFAIFMYGTWIVLFIAILIYILNKINNKEYKGRSNILMNIFIWLIPCLIPLSYFIIYFDFFKFLELDEYGESDKYGELIFWINIPLTIIFMAFASIFIRKWKGLPDE